MAPGSSNDLEGPLSDKKRASCCGVVGYKPLRGRNPVDAPFNLDSYCHTGPMARSVADTLLFQNQLGGANPADPFALPYAKIRAPTGALTGLRVAYSRDLGFFEIDPEVRKATEAWEE